ncbi:MAG: ankyrin repeat domain-containing protein, partial [Acidobacteriaceae bacterium]
FLNVKQAHPDIATGLQEQLDRAMRHFSREGDLKWVSLLLWAGADPRSMGPNGMDEDDPEAHVTALQQATAFGHVEILKKFKLSRERDDLSRLLHEASFGQSSDIIVYLLQLGARPNDRANGGSSSLSRCLHFMHFEGIGIPGIARSRTIYSVAESLRKVRILAEHGAIWNPEAAMK